MEVTLVMASKMMFVPKLNFLQGFHTGHELDASLDAQHAPCYGVGSLDWRNAVGLTRAQPHLEQGQVLGDACVHLPCVQPKEGSREPRNTPCTWLACSHPPPFPKSGWELGRHYVSAVGGLSGSQTAQLGAGWVGG
ncbi:hypothetical protein HaLaN_08174 [Haematococcus lacustris]|uniref:Uncharacterized protein n=1 Tax=Haematococcus lacustris TaxID=44745 RepID=A0A699YTB9_HAELA|nr:hypothetical protein HaLaN_08174 [Haematococcus lacustris]